MAVVVAEEELYRSCHMIFGKDLKVSREFLQYLQLSGIKKAYRKKALEIHPDMGSCRNLILQQSMSHQFIDVHQAYKNLVAYLEVRDKGLGFIATRQPSSLRKREGKAKRPGNNGAGSSKKFYNNNGMQQNPPLHDPPLDPKSLYKGPVPNCHLLFGRYLYYTGIINLHTIGQALIWQRSQRPRLGEIGRRMGWLNEQDTFKILQSRQDRQLFGELALRLGILTREQLHFILLHQKKLHKRIGQYFVAKNYWNRLMLEEYISAHRTHNSRVQNLYT